MENCIESQDEDENENIYEPVSVQATLSTTVHSLIACRFSAQINVPELSPKSPLWRYFSKINIDALVEYTRRKKDGKEDASTASTFSDIRKRFGHHRKSIKNRMKKFYNRSGTDVINENEDDLGSQGASCPSASASDSGTQSLSENSSEKGNCARNEVDQFRKRDRHLFGSIGLLKKSRTSLCLGEVAPRKQHFVNNEAVQLPLKKKTTKPLVEKVCGSPPFILFATLNLAFSSFPEHKVP